MARVSAHMLVLFPPCKNTRVHSQGHHFTFSNHNVFLEATALNIMAKLSHHPCTDISSPFFFNAWSLGGLNSQISNVHAALPYSLNSFCLGKVLRVLNSAISCKTERANAVLLKMVLPADSKAKIKCLFPLFLTNQLH